MSEIELKMRLYMPTDIIFGNGVAAKLPTLAQVKGKRCMVLKFPAFNNKGLIDSARESASYLLDSDVFEENPSTKTTTELSKTIEENNIETVIAIGGGSTIDIAKGAAGIMTQRTGRPLPDIIALPTTSGTGSEISPYSMFVDDNGNKYDYSKTGLLIFPKVALCDPALTVTMPRHVTADTGIDALSHGLEGYFTVACTGMVEDMALACFKRVRDYLPAVLKKPDDIEARAQMMMSSLEGGAVLTACGTVAVHAMGYGLSKALKVTHGHANTIMLASFTEVFAEHGCERAKLVMDLFGGKLREFIDECMDGRNKIKLSPQLIDELVRLGVAKLATLGNPATGLPASVVPLTEADLYKIVRTSSAD